MRIGLLKLYSRVILRVSVKTNGFRFKVQKLLIKLKSQSKSHVKSHYDSHVIFFIKLFILLILGNNYNIEMIENHIANHRVNHI